MIIIKIIMIMNNNILKNPIILIYINTTLKLQVRLNKKYVFYFNFHLAFNLINNINKFFIILSL
jgi:hypothetical protein